MENIENDFGEIASLFGDKSRAKMLWNLMDGRAYTATELANCSNVSLQSASNHLSKLLQKKILTVEKQGRHRYYRIGSPEVAQVIESMASLLPLQHRKKIKTSTPEELAYARTCYKHLAGEVGVKITEAMIERGIVKPVEREYKVTTYGEQWFSDVGIEVSALQKMKRSFAHQCLDWSERKHHLAGGLGDAFLEMMIQEDWIRNHKNSRALVVTSKGKMKIQELLGVNI